MSYKSMIVNSCKEGENTSSKRVVMYHFLYVAIFMVFVQAVFTVIHMWKWAHLDSISTFEVHSVFPDVVWYCVFGIIGGIAGVNGVQSAFKPKTIRDESLS